MFNFTFAKHPEAVWAKVLTGFVLVLASYVVDLVVTIAPYALSLQGIFLSNRDKWPLWVMQR